MSAHTIHNPEKLDFRVSQYEANIFTIGTEDGDWLMSVRHSGEQVEARQIANMRRLVACWNACQGVDTDALEAQPVRAQSTRQRNQKYNRATRR